MTTIIGRLVVSTYCNNGDYTSYAFALIKETSGADVSERLVYSKSAASHGYGEVPTIEIFTPDSVRDQPLAIAALKAAHESIQSCQHYRDWKSEVQINAPMVKFLKRLRAPAFQADSKEG